jgi:membrane protease YdiL (CAAX protease family)
MAVSSTQPEQPVSLPPAASNAPGILYALGLILLYFLLQIAAGTLVSFVAGLFEALRHPDLSHAEVHQHVMTLLQRPDSNALLVILALPLIALVMLVVVRRVWPVLWTLPQPPGFGLTAPVAATWYALALLVGLVMPPLGGILTQWLAHGHDVTQNVEELSRHASGNLRLPLAMVAISVGPLIEELMFRGVLLSALMRRLSTGLSVAICAVLFGVVHLGGLDFEWYALPNLILLAAALCWLRLKSASLWPAILAHSVYNLFALVALFAAA